MARENWRHVNAGLYIVRTQAGFKHIVRQFTEGEKIDVRGFPTIYPSIVALSWGYDGSVWVRVQSVPVSKLQAEIAESDAAAV